MVYRLRSLIFKIRAWIYRHYTPKIRRYYDKAIARHGDSISSLGWKSHYSQFTRFSALFSQWTIEPTDHVLDVGCGFGDLLEYFSDESIHAQYTGIDISAPMIETARSTHPNGQFRVGDLFHESQPVDYVVASGAFSLHTRDQYYYLDAAIAKMLKLAKKGVSFNLLSHHAPTKDRADDLFFYYDPSKVAKIVARHRAKWVMLHHYLPNDFTVVLYKA